MKTLTKIALALVLFATAAASHAQWVNGYSRANGTYVSGHYRTPANGIPYDNFSYRGYTAPRSCYPTESYSTFRSYAAPVSVYGSSTTLGGVTLHNYHSTSGAGLSGSTINIGNTSFTSLYSW